MDGCSSTNYWHGLVHGLLLMLPVAGFLYRKWTQAAARASIMKPDSKPPTLGTFLNELFAFEVVLVAGAELKAVRDQLKDAEAEDNAARVDALKQRVLDVSGVLQNKLQAITPVIHFLLQQSVDCIKAYGRPSSPSGGGATDVATDADEPKKDK